MRRAKILLAVGLAAALAAGCGSGSSHSVDATVPVDVSKLDVAGYNTTLTTIGKQDLNRSKVSEGQRLARVLPLMMEIDPRFKYQDGTDPSAVYGFTDDPIGTDLHTENISALSPGFITGFTVNGATDSHSTIATSAYYTVLLFTDSATASAGAKSLAANQFNHLQTNQPVGIDGHPDTQAFWRPADDEMDSFTAHSRYVIYATVTDYAMSDIGSPDLQELQTLTKKIIEAITPARRTPVPHPGLHRGTGTIRGTQHAAQQNVPDRGLPEEPTGGSLRRVPGRLF